MYIVGIDIGKNHHEASIVSPEGKQIGRSLRFATTHKGADSLMSFIFKNIGNSPCVFGMEATGHYWYPIYSFLKAKGYTIYVINPIQSDSLRKMYIRQTKNDSIDSFLIAKVIRFGQFGTTSMADENILAMRQLCRYRDSVISSRTEIKLRIGTIMEQIFPEYEKQFSSLWVSTSMGILEKYLTPENIENAPIDELFEIIKDKSHNRLTRAKAISIKEAAADTFGIKIAQDAFSFQLKQLIDRMNFLDKQIEALDCQILEYYEKFDCYLHTIPGIGIIGAATILNNLPRIFCCTLGSLGDSINPFWGFRQLVRLCFNSIQPLCSYSTCNHTGNHSCCIISCHICGDVERLPLGKFESNKLVLELTMIAYNILRIIGQESLEIYFKASL